MTVAELIEYLTKNCLDHNKIVLIHYPEWDTQNPIDFVDFDSAGNPVLY